MKVRVLFSLQKTYKIIEGWLNDLWKFNGMNWTWISGSDSINQNGTYGTKGIPSSSNIPGARREAVSWTDSNNTLWLFGGYGYDATGTIGKSVIFK
jgi:hypothetical protein